MPKGYIIAHVTVNDPEAYKEYIRRDTPLLEAAGARPLVRGGQGETAEGHPFSRHVVFEFPSYDAARTFFYSEEYQEVARIRRETADSMIVLVEGVE